MRNHQRGNVAFGVAGVIVAVIAMSIGIMTCAKCEKIRPGYVGVSVRKCGGGGVDKTPIHTGYYWRELFCEDVVQYPTSMETLILTKNPHEGTGGPDGQEQDQSITANSSEGLAVEVDVSLSFMLEPTAVPHIYETYRENVDNIEHKYIRQTIREGILKIFAKYKADDLYNADNKEAARLAIEQFLVEKLKPMGFNINQFTINRIELPEQVVNAIKQKAAMSQDAERAQQEVAKKTAEAAQAVAIAKGKADAMKTEAEGEAAAITLRAEAQAKANKILADSVTPQLVEYQKVLKWSGFLPNITGGATPMIQFK